MNTKIVFTFFSSLCILFISGLVHAASYDLQIEEGAVTSTASFCPPDQCETQSGSIEGSFTAEINGNTILLSNIVVTSGVLGFSLPQTPNGSANGTSYTAEFDFDGEQLTLTGSINSTAFDGPLQKYKLTASVVNAEPSEFSPLGFYDIRQDFRKCASPMCGGVYISKINKRRMNCPNGTKARECYIATTNWKAIGGNPFSTISNPMLKGTISTDNEFNSEWGLFTAEAAYRPANDSSKRHRVYGLKNNGIVCITSPCFSYDQYVINKKGVRQVSQVDLTNVKASKADIELANNLLANGETLIAAGYNRYSRRHFNKGVRFTASQFYLPFDTTVIIDECPEGYAMSDFGCATKHGCFYPQLEQANIGGAAMIDPISGDLIANTSYTCVDACEPPAESTGNSSCALALP